MSHIDSGPLATYNSLTDSHLAGYFANSRMRRHLHKSGLVTKRGEIISETTYRLNMSRKEHKKHVKDMLAQAIVHKTLDLERSRQAEIKKKLEEIAKIQLVRRVRATRGRKGDEDILPMLTPRSSRPNSSPASKSRGWSHDAKYHPYSTPGIRADSRLSQMSVEEEGDVLYLDDEGRPITPQHDDSHRGSAQGEIDTRHLHSLDTAALRKYAMLMAQMEEGRGLASPYLMPQVPLPPKSLLSGRTPRSAYRIKSASPKRPTTTDTKIARLHRPETAKSHAGEQQMMCCVTMCYHGWQLNLAHENMDPRQEVMIEQQHCGGNTLTVFKEHLEAGTTFEFISYRHRGYPFSLTLYLDGKMDSRVSTCCEYRHSRGAKIGGKQGHFSLVSVDGAIPCYKCQVAKGVLMRSKAPPKKPKRPSERHEEVIVVATRGDNQEGEETQQNDIDRQKVEEEEQAVLIPVERDDGRKKGHSEKEAEKSDANYEDDFEKEDSRSSSSSSSSFSSSSSSSSSSDSDSETDTKSSPRKDEADGRRAEHFHPTEPRGEEREATTLTPRDRQQERGDGKETSSTRYESPPRTADRSPSRRPPRTEVQGTGRKIDDYSSDDDDEQRNAKVLSMENVEAEAKVRRRNRSASSSSSSSNSDDDNDKRKRQIRREEDQQQQTTAVVSVELLDREEQEQARARQERGRRDEIKRREEEEKLQLQLKREREREEHRRAEEARRQEEWYQQQKRDEETRQREEERRKQDEDRRKEVERRREEERIAAAQREEERRAQLQRQRSVTRILPEMDEHEREQERQRAQKEREKMILEEQQEREEKRKVEERAREEAWRREQAQRVEQLKQQESKKMERMRSLEESGSSTARTTTSQSSTARSEPTDSSSSPTSSSSSDSEDDTTPRQPSPEQQQKDKQQVVTHLPVLSLSPGNEAEDTAVAGQAAPAIGVGEESKPSVEEVRDEDEERQTVESPRSQRSVSDVTSRSSSPTSSSSDSGESTARSEREDDKHTEKLPTEEEAPIEQTEQSKAAMVSMETEAAATSVTPRNNASGTDDSSSDSSSSSGESSARSASSQEEVIPAAQVRRHSEPGEDDDYSHGGADPDHVAQNTEEKVLPLKTREAPRTKSYEGNVTDLLTSPESVELSNVLLNKQQVYEVAHHIEDAESVKMISLCNTGLDDDDIQRLSEAVIKSPSQPVMLNLTLNSLTEKSVPLVLNILKSKPSIKTLILQSNPLGDDGVRELVSGLESLHREARAQRSTGHDLFADSVSLDSSASSEAPPPHRYLLKELDLADSGMTDLGAGHLGRMLAVNVSVETLSLNSNTGVTAEGGWSLIADDLAKNRYLKSLTLDGNKIGDAGMKHLARGLYHNRTLTSLALEDAGIGEQGGKAIMEMLKRNTTILELTLSPGNAIPEQLMEDIRKYIALNRAPYNTLGL